MKFSQALRPLLLSCAFFTPHIAAQSFLTAISQFQQLSNFTSLFYANPGLANSLLTSNFSADFKQTVLVPDNDAFTKFEATLGAPLRSLSVQQLTPILQYHILVGAWLSENLTQPQGQTIPTYLNGPMYNNRSAGPGLGSSGAPDDPHNGQVVFIQVQNNTQQQSRRFTIRQTPSPTPESTVQSGGFSGKVNLTAVDGYWDGGRFQIVDAFLTLPKNCSETFDDSVDASVFYEATDRTGLDDPIDLSTNITCLPPINSAFSLVAGSDNSDSANITELGDIILFHLIDQPLYTNFLVNGQTFTTFNNMTVTVTLKDGEIWFNDAMVVVANVLTNNGVAHVLDRVMSSLQSPPDSNSNPSASVSSLATLGPTLLLTTTAQFTTTATVTASASASTSTAAAIRSKQIMKPWRFAAEICSRGGEGGGSGSEVILILSIMGFMAVAGVFLQM